MADPVILGTIGIASSAMQGLVGMSAAGMQAEAQSKMYQYQAGVANLNKQIAKQNADYALATGETTAMIQGMRQRSQIGSATARFGASGIASGSGSSADVLRSMGQVAGLEQGIIRNNAARQAYGYEVAATQAGAQAGMYQGAAANAEAAGQMNIMSSLIGGISNVSSKWLSASQSGIFGDTAKSSGNVSSTYYG